jgi:uncharacterized small protein (DUF1192 family)
MAEPWTLAQAQAKLQKWLAAEDAVANNQSYTIDGVSLTRASVREITRQITFWRGEVARLIARRTAGPRIVRIIPRDV